MKKPSKKPRKQEVGDLIIVEWLDQSYYTGPVESGYQASQKAFGETVGFFIEECSDWLCVAMERFETDRVSYRHIVTFPKVAVIKVKEVRRRMEQVENELNR